MPRNLPKAFSSEEFPAKSSLRKALGKLLGACDVDQVMEMLLIVLMLIMNSPSASSETWLYTLWRPSHRGGPCSTVSIQGPPQCTSTSTGGYVDKREGGGANGGVSDDLHGLGGGISRSGNASNP